MTNKISVGVSGAYKDVSAISVGVSGAYKTVSNVWVGVSGVWQKVFSPLAPLTASASPSSQAWSGSLGAYTTTSNLVCTAGGGSGNYTYAWEQSGGSGSISFDDGTAASTGGTSLSNDPVTVRCLVSDDAGSTPVYSNEITVG